LNQLEACVNGETLISRTWSINLCNFCHPC